ncbi:MULTISPECIES: type II toxin-antitoxin system RatA family toxin [unclassified Pseudoalteromonas]|uniref:type II toxin-antitoxin system RatA family toxin n=1 Tax=unclassified Pseudoalteromonas TaxID=194690 RepID=UPI000B3BF3BB|nr:MULTISPECIES: type II toxin-antitoxin system RatA family toxin [unclassified Pseudoalteromonas]MDN3378144.1 type II toxin-antitoxin system RatA family toxin [Pseudoalteromonas sp. APC 3893]MDN3386909.1 type II toxin-antitoxin system RatA family toxin [Pseudoalteromonas sp. APC 4017]OUS74612.1 ubiquinone-binding protein [Pseudoalteromonas sp. A601]
MPQIEKSALVMYSSKEMFNLVNDVDAYPEFLPHCSDAKIVTQQANTMTASLEISKAGIKKWFTTQNTFADENTVTLRLVDGPFKSLQGQWHFRTLDESACKVELRLEFEFSSKLIELAFGKIFNDVAKNMVNAFTQRAKDVYGPRI